MSRHRLGILVVVLLALGVATAVATPPTGFTRTELVRSTIAAPITASATGASDLAGQKVVFEPGSTSPWHSHPGATFVAVKTGTLTVYHGGASGCTSQKYSAGQGFLEPAGDVHFAKNEGSAPAEVYATFVAVPVGAELRKNEANPGGANCPSETGAPSAGAIRTDLARSKVDGPVTVQATAASDVSMQTITVEPGGTGGWHSHPAATFVAVKAGTLTLHHGDANGCTSKSYSAGQGFLEPAGDVHVNRNEGSAPVELYITFLAAPVGAGLRTDEKSPSGANCPERVEAATQLPRTGGAGSAGLLALVGLGLAGAGTAARVLARRR